MNQDQWNGTTYDRNHSLVYKANLDLLDLLSPKKGEFILDVGCGTGYITNQIHTRGAIVLGIDSSQSMIKQARQSYPHLDFRVEDARNLPFEHQFDAIFSNAALHWIQEPEEAINSIKKSLKAGGRLIASFGGTGNVETIITAIYDAIQDAGYPLAKVKNPWYFPSINEYKSLLEKNGLLVKHIDIKDCLTRLEGGDEGMRNWLKMFGKSFLNWFSVEQQDEILTDIENRLRSKLYKNKTWFEDYKRLELFAVKAG